MFENRIIFDTVVGSRAYGTNLPDSDEDTVAVAVPTNEYFYSYRRFEQANSGETDRVIYNVVKMVELMKENNPNCIDILFAPERCIKLTTSYWNRIKAIRDQFISKKCKHTYSGYAHSQLMRINTHRKFLLDPPKKKPERTEFGLPEKSIFPEDQLDAVVSIADDFFVEGSKTVLNEELQKTYALEILPIIKQYLKPEYLSVSLEFFKNNVKNIIFSLNAIGREYLKDEYKEMAIKELLFDAENRKYKRYVEWNKSRNKKRAELEAKVGYDTKHAMHCIRLLSMGCEILANGSVNVDRTDIDSSYLKHIRCGYIPYGEVMTFADYKMKELDSLYKDSPLRKKPNDEAINNTLIGVVSDYLKNIV